MEPDELQLIKGFIDGLRPEPRLTVSEWADLYRFLASTSTAEPGPWRTARTPYLRAIMDDLSSNSPIQEVVFMKGAQVGATEMGFNWLGYIIDVAPGPMLLVQPTDAMTKRNSKMRFDPMIESTPRLRAKIKPNRSRDAGNTTYQKDFAGGVAVLTGANSAVGLRSMPVRYLFLDEVDAYPADLDGEGNPIDLARARTRTFSRKKIFICSTPTIEGASAIAQEFDETDQRFYFVPCPHCETMQRLKWECIKWEPGAWETAQYFCPECGAAIEERHKPYMLAAGEWRPTSPEKVNNQKTGYHLSSLYSPYGWYSWADAAHDWENSQGNAPKLKTFINTVLGETWKEKGEAPAWENLYNRRENYKLNKVPECVCILTAGVDIQRDRIEVEVVGWAENKISYSIDYRVLLGDTSALPVWDELAKIIGETWQRDDGITMPLRLMAVDTGYNTTEVYEFCRRFDYTKVIPVKGQDKQGIIIAPPKAVDYNVKGKKIGKLKVWNVGVSLIKSELYGWLRQERDEQGNAQAGYCHFPEYRQEYFRGLTAEQLEFKIEKGYKKYMWVKKYERNEPLDCRVYARAAASVIGVDRWEPKHWENARNGYSRKADGAPVKRKRSSFW